MVNNNKYNDKGLRGFEARETIKPFFCKTKMGQDILHRVLYRISQFLTYNTHPNSPK